MPPGFCYCYIFFLKIRKKKESSVKREWYSTEYRAEEVGPKKRYSNKSTVEWGCRRSIHMLSTCYPHVTNNFIHNLGFSAAADRRKSKAWRGSARSIHNLSTIKNAKKPRYGWAPHDLSTILSRVLCLKWG